jgi:tetratricopeptide (TPR) repeat protein
MVLACASTASCASAPPEASLVGDYLSGRIAARFNHVGEAARVFEAAHRGAPQDVSLLKDAFFYRLAAGDISQAAAFARAILARDAEADDGLARLTAAVDDLHSGRLDAARRTLKAGSFADHLKSAAFLLDVWIERDVSGPVAAIAMLDNPPADVFAGFNPLHKALLSEAAGNMDDARAAYQIAVLGAGGPIGRRGYGAFLERSGDAAAARDYFALLSGQDSPGRRAAASFAKRAQSGRRSAEFKDPSGRQGAAIALYSLAQIMIEQAADQRMRAELAGLNVGEPRFNLPLSLARLAAHLDPRLDEANRLAGNILNIYGDLDGAAGYHLRIEAASPYFEQSRLELAGEKIEREDYKGAERLLLDAIRRDPEGLDLKASLANLYARRGDHARAVRLLDALIADLDEPLDENHWKYLVSRGAALLELGRWTDAEADLKRAVEIAPSEPEALNYLGYSWAERGENLDQAFALIDKAVELRPDSGAIIDSLGWAHYQLGRYSEAVGHLEKAAALEPDDPTVTDHLGDVYWRLGRRIEARYEWRRGLELDPPDKLKASLEAKLARGLGDDEAGVKDRK